MKTMESSVPRSAFKMINLFTLALGLFFLLGVVACKGEGKAQDAEYGEDTTLTEDEVKPTFAEDKPIPGKPPTARNKERLALILSRRSIDDVGQVREEGLLAATLLSDGTGFREIADLPQELAMSDVALMRDLENVLYISGRRTSVNTKQEEWMLIQRHLKTGEEKELIYGPSINADNEHLRHMPTGMEEYRLLFKNGKAYARSENDGARVFRFEYHPFTHSVFAANGDQAVLIDFMTGKRKTNLVPGAAGTRIGLNQVLSMDFAVGDSNTAGIFNFVQNMGDNRFRVLDTALGKITFTVGGVNADFSRLILGRRMGPYPIEPNSTMPRPDQLVLSDTHFKTLKILPRRIPMELSGDGNDLYFWANGIALDRKGGGAIWRVASSDLPDDASELTFVEIAPRAEKIMDLINFNVVNLQIHPLEN